ncbi:hypothetical protein Btru_076844 [Bulinus truncatus]|nr:hypothetical protein Btru_076844 [Bulinus truncatus]
MWSKSFLLLASLSCVARFGRAQHDDDGEVPSFVLISRAVTLFSQAVFHSFAPFTDNLLYSPFSAHSALSMLMMGAREETRDSMEHTLAVSDIIGPHFDYDSAYSDLLHNLTSKDGKDGDNQVMTANGMWVKESISIIKDYKDDLVQFYDSEADTINSKAPNGPEGPINEWVAKKTNTKIPTLLPQGTINTDTAMILINTLYFSGTWQSPFDKDNTKKGDFHTVSGEAVQIDFMNMYAGDYEVRAEEEEDDMFDTIRIPFKNQEYAFYVLLPKPKVSIEDLEGLLAGFDDDDFDNVIRDTKQTKVNLSLPKFKLTVRLNMNRTLSDPDMGMGIAFSEHANFTGIAPEPLRLSDVIQQATIELTESGTVASAATSVNVESRSAAIDFKVDRPFVFFLRDEVHELLLFQGKFSDPRHDNVELH